MQKFYRVSAAALELIINSTLNGAFKAEMHDVRVTINLQTVILPPVCQYATNGL